MRRMLCRAALIMVLVPSSSSAGWSFLESYDDPGAMFDNAWVTTITLPPTPSPTGSLPIVHTRHQLGGFTLYDGAHVYVMIDGAHAHERLALTAEAPLSGAVGELEARVHTSMNQAVGIDGIVELWLLSVDDPTRFVTVALFGGHYGTVRSMACLSSEEAALVPFSYQDDTWYLLRITATTSQLRVSVWDDTGTTELIGHDLGFALATLGSSFRIALAQYVDNPDDQEAHTVVALVDYIEARGIPVGTETVSWGRVKSSYLGDSRD